MKINIKKINEDAIIPTQAHKGDAGYDLYAYVDKTSYKYVTPGIVIPAHMTRLVKTGIAMEIPEGYVGLIYSRSGIATKRGLRLANCVGVIDSTYRGEIMLAIHNDTQEDEFIHHGERIAQIVITPYLNVEFNEVNELNETDRGEGGFGSSGR